MNKSNQKTMYCVKCNGYTNHNHLDEIKPDGTHSECLECGHINTMEYIYLSQEVCPDCLTRYNDKDATGRINDGMSEEGAYLWRDVYKCSYCNKTTEFHNSNQ